MLNLARLTLGTKQYAKNTSVSNEDFLNELLYPFVYAGNIQNKENEEFYLDKTRASLILNQKSDVPRALRKALTQFEIKEKTEAGMADFVSDYLNPALLSQLKAFLNSIVSEDKIMPDVEKQIMIDKSVTVLLADLLLMSLSVKNAVADTSNIIWQCGDNKIEVVYGDLFHYGFKNRKSNKNIIVIPFNTAFDTVITRKLDKKSAPIVSENTLHGQWIIRMNQSGINIKTIDERISESLSSRSEIPVSLKKNTNGKAEIYDIGSIAIIDEDKACYFLLAISEFDNHNNARSNKNYISKAILSLLQTHSAVGQGYDMYLPLMGTGSSRAGLSIKEAYSLITESLIRYSDLIRGHVYLVLKPDIKTELEGIL